MMSYILKLSIVFNYLEQFILNKAIQFMIEQFNME